MAVLECVKPGAKFGQIILVVDLTVAVDRTLAKIQDLGDHSEIRQINYPSGVHVLAILKDSQHSEVVEDDYLLEDP